MFFFVAHVRKTWNHQLTVDLCHWETPNPLTLNISRLPVKPVFFGCLFAQPTKIFKKTNYLDPPRGGVWTLRGCLVAPLTIHLAPLGGSRYISFNRGNYPEWCQSSDFEGFKITSWVSTKSPGPRAVGKVTIYYTIELPVNPIFFRCLVDGWWRGSRPGGIFGPLFDGFFVGGKVMFCLENTSAAWKFRDRLFFFKSL